MDELRLIKQIQRNGNRSAADELINKYYDNVYYFVKKQVGNEDLAHDLTQEIFVSCLRAIVHYKPKKDASFKTWLYKIATNKTVDYFRSRAYQEAMKTLPIDEVEPISEADFVYKFENADFTERVCAYVGCLPQDTQNIFRLHIFGEYTFTEIAKMLEMPEGSVKSKYYRLINLLRKEFADHE